MIYLTDHLYILYIKEDFSSCLKMRPSVVLVLGPQLFITTLQSLLQTDANECRTSLIIALLFFICLALPLS